MIRQALLAALCAFPALVACGGSSSPPADVARDAFQERLHAEINPKAEVRSFEKTDGLRYTRDGVDRYDLEYIADITLPGGQPEADTYRGKVLFLHTEQGWRVDGVNGVSAAQAAAETAEQERRKTLFEARRRINLIEASLNLYKIENSIYPTTEQGLQALATQTKIEPLPKFWKEGGYLRELPLDPWGNPYHYESPGKHGDIDIYTWGADNAPGGDGMNADLSNWQTGG